MARVLIVEDQKKLLQSLKRGLEEEGYDVVYGVRQRRTALEELVAGGRLEKVDDVGVPEAHEIEALDGRLPAELRQVARQRMRARQVALSEGPYHHD